MTKPLDKMSEAERLRHWIEIIKRGEAGQPQIVKETDSSITLKFPKQKPDA